jgi:hypothetical protein
MRRSIDQAPTVILWPIRTELKYEKGQLGAAPIWLWAPASAGTPTSHPGRPPAHRNRTGHLPALPTRLPAPLIAWGGCRAQWMALLLNTDGDLTWS